MTQVHEPPPSRQTARIERSELQPGRFEPPGEHSPAGRVAAIVAMFVAITLLAAGAGFLLAGGRLPSSSVSPTPTPAPTAVAQAAPATAPAPTAPPAPTIAPTAPPKPTAPPPTAPPQAKPTEPPPPTAAPRPTDPPPAKPASAPPAAAQGVHSPARPGMDPRLAQIEGRVNEYFAALGDQDFARAQQVCCTPEWRARFPLDRWQRNFDGVTDLHLINAPRYQQVSDDAIVVDTDYTFVSGGTRRNFTLRWTFKPVGSEWQADLAEAFPTQ